MLRFLKKKKKQKNLSVGFESSMETICVGAILFLYLKLLFLFSNTAPENYYNIRKGFGITARIVKMQTKGFDFVF